MEDPAPGRPEKVDFGFPMLGGAEDWGDSFQRNFQLGVLVYYGYG